MDATGPHVIRRLYLADVISMQTEMTSGPFHQSGLNVPVKRARSRRIQRQLQPLPTGDQFLLRTTLAGDIPTIRDE